MRDTTTTDRVLRLVLTHQRRARTETHPGDPCARCLAAHVPRVGAFVELNRPVEFVLPAFPVKSPNPAKVLGRLPDMAEELAVRFLDELCTRIAEVYPPGAKVIICADGRVFGDLIGVPDPDVTAYQQRMRELLDAAPSGRLSLFTLDNAKRMPTHGMLRDWLDEDFGESAEDLRREVCDDPATTSLYRGLCRFLFEDRATPDYAGTRAALQRESRRRAYGVLSRSRAWGRVVQQRFPAAIRLSIHPQPCGDPKLGLLLGTGHDAWLTPWHAVAVETSDGYRLMKRAEAEALGARLVRRDGRPSHFTLEGA
ncbi:pyoverdine biosynthesis protein PvcA [Pseudonocardiaceae bacterium YIM PH 21723]|nr:pyoverdine biosynthesis protein PvcA [Pseudonocardiaceae bacterium YIM PH 21723]